MRTVALSCRAFCLLHPPADEIPPVITRVLTRKVPGGDAYWTYTKGAHRA